MRRSRTIEIRLVVDTNVRLAAELAPSKETSAAAQLLRLVQRKVYERVVKKTQRVVIFWLRSLELQDELREQLTKRGFRPNWILGIVRETGAFSELVTVEEADISALRKQAPAEAIDDIHVIACAVKGKATHIVTYDERHLLVPTTKQFLRRFGIKVVKPEEMLTELRRLGDP